MRSAEEPPQDIIQFYNVVFIPTMKDHLLSVCSFAAAQSRSNIQEFLDSEETVETYLYLDVE
jgi:hypothetical protein